MKQQVTAVFLFLAILLAALGVGGVARSPAAAAQGQTPLACTGENLLVNPSFEGQYTAYILPPPGHPDCQTLNPNEPNQYCSRIQMPAGWHPFWRDSPRDNPTMNILPEYKPGELWETPPRVHNGERSQHYFSFYSTHEAGVYQQITAVPGGQYCFSAWGHAWSANTTTPDFTSTDDHGFLYQKIGIDPTGGTDWQSANIIWSEPQMQYDVFGQFVVEATAVSDTVTVFLHSRPDWPVKHNDVYWDDTFLALSNQMTVSGGGIGLVTAVDQPATVTQTLAISVPIGTAWNISLDPNGSIAPTLSAASGTGSAEVQAAVSSQGLPVGTYTNTLTIAAPGTVGSPVTLPVRVRVAAEVWHTYLPAVWRP